MRRCAIVRAPWIVVPVKDALAEGQAAPRAAARAARDARWCSACSTTCSLRCARGRVARARIARRDARSWPPTRRPARRARRASGARATAINGARPDSPACAACPSRAPSCGAARLVLPADLPLRPRADEIEPDGHGTNALPRSCPALPAWIAPAHDLEATAPTRCWSCCCRRRRVARPAFGSDSYRCLRISPPQRQRAASRRPSSPAAGPRPRHRRPSDLTRPTSFAIFRDRAICRCDLLRHRLPPLLPAGPRRLNSPRAGPPARPMRRARPSRAGSWPIEADLTS